jgi:hypothetical protein
MTTTMTVNAIVNTVSYGMTFDSVLSAVKAITTDIDVTVPSDDMFGYISYGDDYGDSVVLEFDDDDTLESITVYTLDDFED